MNVVWVAVKGSYRDATPGNKVSQGALSFCTGTAITDRLIPMRMVFRVSVQVTVMVTGVLTVVAAALSGRGAEGTSSADERVADTRRCPSRTPRAPPFGNDRVSGGTGHDRISGNCRGGPSRDIGTRCERSSGLEG